MENYSELMNGTKNLDAKANHEQLTFTILLILINTTSLFGNGFVISSVYSVNKRKRTVFMKSKVSLAISDIGYALTSVLYIVDGIEMCLTDSLPKRPDFWPLLQINTSAFFISVSVYNVAVMALLRCYAINRPLDYKNLPVKKQNLFIASAWFPGLLAVVLVSLYDHNNSAQKGYLGIVGFCLTTIIPFVVLLASTMTMLAVFLWSEQKSGVNVIGTTSSQRNHWKMVKITFLMVCGYGLVYVPYIVSGSIFFAKGENVVSPIEFPSYLRSTTLILNLTGIIDILIYSVFDEQFRYHILRTC